MKGIIVSISLLASCTILTQSFGACESQTPRCDGADLVFCQEDTEVVFAAGCSPGADLAGAPLADADLRGADLNNADLSDAILSRALLQSVSFTGAELSGAQLDLADASGADMTEAALSGANLNGTDLFEANLKDANMSGAILLRTITKNLFKCPAILPSASFTCIALPNVTEPNGDTHFALLGPDVNLSGANLKETSMGGADLTNAALSGSSLEQASLNATNLTGAQLNDTGLEETDLNNTNLTNANLNIALGDPLNEDLAIYSNTICPDGQNSDDVGGTCVGHFLP